MGSKNHVGELAVFGGARLFGSPKSAANPVRPDIGRFLDYSRQFFDKRQYTNGGPNVRLLERRLAEFHESEFCVTFCSGFWALALTISALARPGRTEIVMPSLTYRSLADIAAWVNLKPRFCEVDETTLGMTPDTLRPCIGDDTALILAVHPMVHGLDVIGLGALAEDAKIPLLFDSVQSLHVCAPAGRVRGFGRAEVFSLRAGKLLNGFEGGYVTTSDGELARRLALTRAFGFAGVDNIAVGGGTNAKLNEVHAAMALASLDSVEEQIAHHRRNFHEYKQRLASIAGIRLLGSDAGEQTGYRNVVVELLEGWPLTRDETVRVLDAEGILARPYYAPPLHRKPMAYPHFPAELPLTDALAERFLNLPSGALVDPEDVAQIVGILRFLAGSGSQVKDRLHQKGTA